MSSIPDKFNCPCDKFIHPQEFRIPAGLGTIPRQIATFSQFRRAMLADIRNQMPLANWRVRGKDDLGLMLLEMWAYVSDVLTFYDEVIANEIYIRTALRRPSLRKLVELLGYIPRPAVSASVSLALFADGRKPVILPDGMSFRSGAFDGEPPQMFELVAETTIHPLTNRWTIESLKPTTIGVENPAHLLLDPDTVRLEAGDLVLVQVGNDPGQTQACTVKDLITFEANDGNTYVRADFNAPLLLSKNTLITDLKLSKPTQAVSLWTLADASAPTSSMGDSSASESKEVLELEDSNVVIRTTLAIEDPSGPNTRLTLDGIYRQIKPGMFIILARENDYRWFKIISVNEVNAIVNKASSQLINNKVFTIPAVTVRVTQLTLDVSLNDSLRKPDGSIDLSDANKAEIIIHRGFIDGGSVIVKAKTVLESYDPLNLVAPIETLEDGKSPARFIFEDKNQRVVKVEGRLNFSEEILTLNKDTTWDPALIHPVESYGNIVTASRGETVTGEILGNGDASLANQSFVLKKKPLTYVPSPTADNELGVTSTLEVYVNGIRWMEVPSFFGVGPEEGAYIVRQNDEQETIVSFGDGIRGARLPTGTGNVIANYRFGAGAASPPAGLITQLAKPVKGVESVKNPVPAAGGADAESAENLRVYAPRSALILGRAVSIQDMEAIAAGVGGVRAVQAEWRWHEKKQRAVVQIWYIGEQGIEDIVLQTVRGLSDPSIPIDVEAAQAFSIVLSINIEIDPHYLEKDVLVEVRNVLMGKDTGLLSPERIGIGLPLFRSRIFEAVIAVSGVNAIKGIYKDGLSFNDLAISPGAGKYFDLEKGALLLNGKESDNE